MFRSCHDCGGLITKLCLTLAIAWTVAHQIPLSMGFSRQEYWSGLPYSFPRDLSNSKKKTGPKTEPWSRHSEFERQTQQRNLRRSSQRGKRPPCKPSDDGISRRKRGQLSDNTSLDLRTIQLGNVEVPGGGGDFCGVDGRGQPGWNRFKKAWKESNEGQQV